MSKKKNNQFEVVKSFAKASLAMAIFWLILFCSVVSYDSMFH